MSQLRFDNRVVVVTGAGAGLGRQYALFFASRGAKVVVNDLGGSMKGEGASSKAADTVVDEIKAMGGQAVANYDSVEFGDKIIQTAMNAFGRVDVVINNAGILRDVSFMKMTDKDWDLVLKVHLYGSYSVSKAAWNIMRDQGFGRIINTTSASGLYGSFGQANYSAAKLGIHGLTLTLAKEGEKRNIRVNSIAPVAASRMTETVMPQEALDNLKPEYIVPLVGYLAHESCEETGSAFELGAGWIAKVRTQRSQGSFFDLPFTPEDVRDQFAEVCDFTRNNEIPTGAVDTFPKFTENLERIKNKIPANKPQTQAAQPAATSGGAAAAAAGGDSGLKSEKIFNLMGAYLAQGHGKDLITQIQGVYNFGISPKKGAPVKKTWIIDLKNGQGSVVAGESKTADASFVMSDEDFEQVCFGKLNPQNAFIQGKMKIKGNMKKATIFTPELFPQPTPENFAKYMGGAQTAAAGGATQQPATSVAAGGDDSGLKSEKIFNLMGAYLAQGHGKDLITQIQGVYNFGISPKKGAPVKKTWIIDLKNGQGSVVAGESKTADASFVMSDEDFEQVCFGKLNPQNAFIQGKMKIKGNMKKATIFTPELFPQPTPENFAKYMGGSATAAPAATTQTPAAPAGGQSGLKSENIFNLMAAFLEQGHGKDIVASVQGVYNFGISPKKGAPVAKSWIIDLKNGQGKVIAGETKDADASFAMGDDDFEQVCLGKLNPQNAFIQGKMKIKGNMKKATIFTPELFPKPTPENFAKYTKAKL